MKSSASMVRIDPKKIERFIYNNRISRAELSRELGLSQSAVSVILKRGTISKQTLKLMCTMFGFPESTFTPDPEPSENTAQAGYSLSLDVKPDKARVAVLFDGRELYSAFCKVSDNTETALMRAISCASHICYELAQQKELEG